MKLLTRHNKNSFRQLSPGLITIGLVVLFLGPWRSWLVHNWGLGATLIIVLTLVLFYLDFENRISSSREIGVTAVLATVAALGRVPFAVIPGIQPTTFLVILAGFVFGPRVGFMVGATAALVSNFFLGQGPWTPVQMLIWGLAGISAGILGHFFPRTGRGGMSLFSFVWGYAFGWLMDLWFWLSFVHPLSWHSFLTTYAASFPFDTMHALGNVVFCLIFGPRAVKILQRFQKKLIFK